MVDIKVDQFKNHSKIKDRLLHLISKAEQESKHNVSCTDYYLAKNKPREYLKLLFNNMEEHLNLQCEYVNSKTCVIDNAWFHQYYNNSGFEWHTHPHSNFSCVYYLELPNDELATKFANYKCPKIKEGDIIIFPSFMHHCSPVNKTNFRKTIISWNCNFYDWNGKNAV